MHTLCYTSFMKLINWNSEKSLKLKKERGISFEDITFYIKNNLILDNIVHPNQEKYRNQKILILNINNYAHLVPYIETQKEMFLKTIIPSRKATKKYLSGESNEN